MSDNMQTSSYVGSWLCGPDGSFETYPTITFDFPAPLEGWLPGLTITWSTAYEEWATLFRVTAYQEDTAVYTKTVTNDSVKTIMEGDIHDYTRITLEIMAWSVPFRRARMEAIVFGVQKVYEKRDIMGYSATMSVDPLSAELPKSEIRFEIKNLNGEYNPDNPQGIEKYLMERQTVAVSYGYSLEDGVEWIPGGVFYLSEWETPQNGITATFTARDALEFMTDTYTGQTTGTLYRIAKTAFQQANLPSLADGSDCWRIHPSLEGMCFSNEVDISGYSIAEVLQCVANAACCVLYQDRKGQFHIEPLPIRMTDYSIDRFNSYGHSELVLTKPLKAVEVNQGQHLLTVDRSGETQPVVNPLISDARAPEVARWVADILSNRRTLSGEFRVDPRLDPMDIVTNVNQFSESRVLITDVKFSYNGAFRGTYEGRGADNLFGHHFYSGEIYTGEV